MSLKDTIDAYKAEFVKRAPPEARAIMLQATENLRNSGILARTVKVGDVAPDFTLADTDGNDLVLADLLDRGPVVLGFYRGRW